MTTHRTDRRFNTAAGHLAAAVLILAAATLPAGAAGPRNVTRSGPMPADGRLSLENLAGSVTVTGWDRAEIALTGTLGEEVEDLEFSTGDRTRVKVIFERTRHEFHGNRSGADLKLQVPHGCRLDINGVSADIRLSGLDGDVAVTSVSGLVDVQGACRELKVENVSGAVTVDGAGRRTEVSTVSGSLEVRCDDADLQVETVTGEATVDCATLRNLKADTVNGTITMTGRPAAGATIEAESINGSLTLAVPADVSAAFDVSTFNGSIDNAFGQKPERADKYVPGLDLKFSNGKGDADVKLNTLNGKISILKK
jgi:DUF4097 and DUF4098 domain-containing protein YvlB